MKKLLFIIILQIVFASGCSTFRPAPTEMQKQNAWLHNRTAQVLATTAEVENSSQKMLYQVLLAIFLRFGPHLSGYYSYSNHTGNNKQILFNLFAHFISPSFWSLNIRDRFDQEV